MMSSRRRVVTEALERDLSAELAEGAVDEPGEPVTDADPDVLVGRSVRLPLRADEALKRAARDRGATPSDLIASGSRPASLSSTMIELSASPRSDGHWRA